MKIEYMPLEDLQRHERNPKTHDIPAIDKSISRFGYVNPIVIDERTGKIVAGHGRLDTLSEKFKKGEDPPPRIKQNGNGWLVPVVRGIEFKNDLEAEGYLIADNRLTEIGGWNEPDLVEALKGLDGKIDGVGFSKADLDAFLDTFEPQPVETQSKLDKQIITCPHCGKDFER